MIFAFCCSQIVEGIVNYVINAYYEYRIMNIRGAVFYPATIMKVT